MIELSEEISEEIEQPRRSFKWQLIRLGLFVGSAFAVALAIMYYSSQSWGYVQSYYEDLKGQAIGYLYSYLPEPPVETQIITADAVDIDTAISLASEEFNIHPLILQGIADQESAYGKYLYRYEPHLFKSQKGQEGDRRMLASSHGVMHVLGNNANKMCGLHWSELYNTRKGVWCGALILRRNLDSVKGSGAQRLEKALSMYNTGSADSKTGGEYADKVLSHMMRRQMQGVIEGL